MSKTKKLLAAALATISLAAVPATSIVLNASPSVPLACGRPDTVANLQWQTVRAARAKDRWELSACGR